MYCTVRIMQCPSSFKERCICMYIRTYTYMTCMYMVRYRYVDQTRAVLVSKRVSSMCVY